MSKIAQLEKRISDLEKRSEHKVLVINFHSEPDCPDFTGFVGYRLGDNSREWLLNDGETKEELKARVDADLLQHGGGLVVLVSVFEDEMGELHSFSRD